MSSQKMSQLELLISSNPKLMPQRLETEESWRCPWILLQDQGNSL